MSDDPTLQEIVVEEALDYVDIESVINGDGIGDEVEAGEIGAAAGARIGERFGRSIGERFGRAIQETATDAMEEGLSLRSFLEELVVSLRNAIAAWLEEFGQEGLAERVAAGEVGGDAEGESVPGDELEESGEGEGADESDDSTTGEGEPDSDEEGETETEMETETESDEGGETETDEDSETETDTEAIVENGPPSLDTLEDLRRETLEDVLEMLSYRDLQSVAKDVDVKANLKGAEMREQIVDAVLEEET
ncbi:hypothetical protein [Natronosalvus halobius]|uniref:hypothetical protein n=1 Tax=Natronosalvus halobius TaxID=2953746 RepID=UPI00209ECBD6|nr:hypothetical protein [Natronosalvus halobius]USZ71710.1 hypothetical protein NGM15_16875 [Natronosalvus halobius]